MRTIFDCDEYAVVEDPRIPLDQKENIILKPPGLKIVADYYFDKYNIIILIHPQPVKINALAQCVKDVLSAAKKSYPAASRLGFIFLSSDEPTDQFFHALPMLWEKEQNGQEHLFFLDTGQYLGATEERYLKPGVLAFRDTLKNLMPLQLWSVYGRRQLDYSSCYTDALVILKDALRLPSLKDLAEKKIKTDTATELRFVVFYAPEVLLKTAQRDSYVDKAAPDHIAGWRQKYAGTFTLFKARKYERRIEARKTVEAVLRNFQ